MSSKNKYKAPTVVIQESNALVESLFKQRGWDITSDTKEADLMCFTGGADITPFLYGEAPITISGRSVVNFDPIRDMKEIKAWRKFDGPKVGICRGGQLLNVLSGGAMWQHVDGHLGSHDMEYLVGYKELPNKKRERIVESCSVSSTHHQMMIPGDQGEVLGWAGKAHNKYCEGHHITIKDPALSCTDSEIIYYWATSSLCFQPHPEYLAKDSDCTNLFFKYIAEYLNVASEKDLT